MINNECTRIRTWVSRMQIGCSMRVQCSVRGVYEYNANNYESHAWLTTTTPKYTYGTVQHVEVHTDKTTMYVRQQSMNMMNYVPSKWHHRAFPYDVYLPSLRIHHMENPPSQKPPPLPHHRPASEAFSRETWQVYRRLNCKPPSQSYVMVAQLVCIRLSLSF